MEHPVTNVQWAKIQTDQAHVTSSRPALPELIADGGKAEETMSPDGCLAHFALLAEHIFPAPPGSDPVHPALLADFAPRWLRNGLHAPTNAAVRRSPRPLPRSGAITKDIIE